MNMAYAQSSLGVSEILNRLAKKARAERLELALPLINALRVYFSPEKTSHGAPVGVLTVGEWLELFERWDAILGTLHQRRIRFMREFFQEFFNNLPSNTPAALLQALQELLATMDNLLSDNTHAAHP
ncbi:MAG: hypothetical protein HQL88_00120 [Magnetococcales bacterium]|nr:hypothetical protein [Magnetococcales bacterium]